MLADLFCKLKNQLLYSGLSKEEYDDIQEQYLAPNGVMIKAMSLCAGLLACLFGIFDLAILPMDKIGLCYLTVGVVNLILAGLARLKIKNNTLFVKVLARVFMWSLYALGMVAGTIGQPDQTAVLFIVFIVALPIVFNDRPIYLLGEMALMALVFSILAASFKPSDVAYLDIFNAIVFAIGSITLSTFLYQRRAAGCLAEKELQDAFALVNEQFGVLCSISEIYQNIHLIDFDKNIIKRFTPNKTAEDSITIHSCSNTVLYELVDEATRKDYKDAAFRFTDLTTLQTRMRNKKIISKEFISWRKGWYRVQFILLEADENKNPVRVIFTSQVIDEEKRQKDLLVQQSQTDELTGFYNRRVYDETVAKYKDTPIEHDFVYISIDVNGLKATNDTLGHVAGDELIVGACLCMKETLGNIGKLFRTGGDEFACLALADEKELKTALFAFNDETAKWKGNFVNGISVSYGVVIGKELHGVSVEEMAIIADQRMYASKRAYYKKKGL